MKDIYGKEKKERGWRGETRIVIGGHWQGLGQEGNKKRERGLGSSFRQAKWQVKARADLDFMDFDGGASLFPGAPRLGSFIGFAQQLVLRRKRIKTPEEQASAWLSYTKRLLSKNQKWHWDVVMLLAIQEMEPGGNRWYTSIVVRFEKWEC